jgi:hypothetical protein
MCRVNAALILVVLDYAAVGAVLIAIQSNPVDQPRNLG